MSSPDVPTNVTRIVVAGYFTDSNDVATAGKLVVTPDFTRGINDAWRRIVMAAPTSMEPSAATGLAYVSVVAGDDPDLNPSNFTHTVSEPGGRKYQIFVSQDTPVWTAGTPGHPLEGQRVLWLNSVAPSDAPSSGVVQVVAGPQGPPGEVSAAQLSAAVAAAKLADRPDLDTTGAAVGGLLAVSQVSPLGVKVGPRLTAARLAMEPGRRAFELNLTQRTQRKIIGCWIGASTAEGSVAEWDRKMTILLEKMFQHSYNPPDIPGGFTVKARDAGIWITSGTTGETPDLDMMKLRTLTAGATLTANIPGKLTTGLQIHYLEGAGAGAFTVTIDGGSPYTITPNTALAADSPTGVWESPVLARGQHTYVITAVAACSIGNTTFRDGDRDRGFTLYNFGRAGGGTSVFLPSANPTLWQRMAAKQPDVVPIQLGHNDMGARTIAEYKTNLGLIVDQINASSPGKTVWVPCIAQQSTTDTYPAFAEALREFAATRPNCTFHSYREFMGTTQAEVDASTEGLWYTDYTHLISKGHEFAAQLLADQFGIPSRRTWSLAPPAADNTSWNWTTDPALLAFWDPNTLAETTGAAVASLPVATGSLSGAALVQATAGKQPTVAAGPNSRKAVKFVAASSQELAVTFAAQTTPATVLAVWRRSGTTGTRLFSGAGTDYLSFLISSGAPYLYRLDTKIAPAGQTTWVGGPDQNWHIAVAVYDGANTRIYADSRTPVTVAMSTTPAAWNSMSLGRNNTAAAFADHENSGLVAFSRALTTFEVGRLFDDFATRTGLTVGN